MTTKDIIVNRYFYWLSNIVCGNRFGPGVSFQKLLMQLHNTDFRFSVPKDDNRANDGLSLRYRFKLEFPSHLQPDISAFFGDKPCSVLEMMVALSIYCEEHIMDNPIYGDRTGQWFWQMIANLGLADQTDDRFDKKYVISVLDRFLDRKYDRDGTGGLFRVRNSTEDMRKLEIFHQLCRYLENVSQ